MDKTFQFGPGSKLGDVFSQAIDITPRGGGLQKTAGRYTPELTEYMRQLRPDPRYQYVLMTPMGSFEYWSLNYNGDAFPELGLAFDLLKDNASEQALAIEERWLRPYGLVLPPGDYSAFGFRTFMGARRHVHHQNTDPTTSFGEVTFTTWDPVMHRTEVVSRHDRERAKQLDLEDIIRDYDNGISRPISMGAKLKFDVCSVCGKLSTRTQDYCVHLRTMMGRILPDGKVVAALNLFPRFFEISDVIIEAAKESGTLKKVAGIAYTPPSILKKAEVIKQPLSNIGPSVVSQLAGAEKDLPLSLFDNPADFDKLLTTLTLLGIVLKPQEFQYAALTRSGDGDLAKELAASRRVFPSAGWETTCGSCDNVFSSSDFDPDLAERLSPLLPQRSGFAPFIGGRIRISILGNPNPQFTDVEKTAQLVKVASAYKVYREGLANLPDLIKENVVTHQTFYDKHFFSSLLEDAFIKTAGAATGSLLAGISPVYFFGAYRSHGSDIPPAQWETTFQKSGRV